MNEIKYNQTVKAFSSRLLTGCCGASLSILKTCATFPLALRCILKPGMAQRVARLMILYSKEAKCSACVCNDADNQLHQLHFPLNLKSPVSIGRNFLNMFYWSMGRKIHRQLEYQQNRWWKSEEKQSEDGQTGRELNRSTNAPSRTNMVVGLIVQMLKNKKKNKKRTWNY